jgi:hypothetical protein
MKQPPPVHFMAGELHDDFVTLVDDVEGFVRIGRHGFYIRVGVRDRV